MNQIFRKNFRSEEGIKSYHAHIYYDGASKQHAGHIRREVERKFDVEMGRWRDKAVGPHPVSSFQITFSRDVFTDLMPFLALNRGNLNILIHANTGDGVADHTIYAMWVGPSIPLNADWMERNKERLERISKEMAL